MSRPRLLRLLVPLLLLLIAFDAAARQWTYKGSQLEGELQRVNGDIVVIKKATGGVIIANRGDFSSEDRQYIRSFEKNGGKAPTPAKPKPKPKPTTQPADSAANDLWEGGTAPADNTTTEPDKKSTGNPNDLWKSGSSTTTEEDTSPAPVVAPPSGISPKLDDIQAGETVKEAAADKEGQRKMWRHVLTIVIAIVIFVISMIISGFVLMLSCKIWRERVSLAGCIVSVTITFVLCYAVNYGLERTMKDLLLETVLTVPIFFVISLGVLSWILDLRVFKAIGVFFTFAFICGSIGSLIRLAAHLLDALS